MKNKIKSNLIFIYIVINLIYLFIGSILKFYNIIGLETFSYGYIGLLVTNIIMICYLIYKKKYIKNKIDIFLILIIIFAVISTIFAYNPMKSLFGCYGRYEGLFVILYYISTLFIVRFINQNDIKKVVYIIIAICIINGIFSVCQKFNLFNVKTILYEQERWSTGLVKNPNFFGTLILIGLCYSIGIYIDEKNKFKKNIFFIITLFLFLNLLFSNSLGCIVGLFLVMLFLLFYSMKTKVLSKYILLCFSFLLILLFAHFISATTIISDVYRTKNETINITKGNFDDNYGTGRLYVWKRTIKVVPKYIIHGVGVDNFSNIIDGNAIIRGVDHHFKYDKAHNEYLQILVTMGIFSLISYLCLHFLIIKEGLKNAFKNKEIYLILPVIGYLVQAQFNISVIEVAPLFYIALGLIINKDGKFTKK